MVELQTDKKLFKWYRQSQTDDFVKSRNWELETISQS